MNVLAVDTCFNACSVAIGRRKAEAFEPVSACFEPMASGQAERLLPMISDCLAEAKMTMAGISKIVVSTGPGTFTGTRIGISAAKGLALVNRTPVTGLSSLHLMARQVACAAPQTRDIAILVDMRRDEVYMQLFDNTGLIAKTEPALMALPEAREFARSSTAILSGNGAALVACDVHGQSFDGRANSSAYAAVPMPDARYALDIVYGSLLPDAVVSPLYLRAPDAKPSSVPALQRQ